jgi:host factor-I protein
MGSSSGRRPADLDTSQPGVRQIQSWIRTRANLVVQLQDGSTVSGIPRWIDSTFLALQQDLGEDVLLVNREAIGLIRVLV